MLWEKENVTTLTDWHSLGKSDLCVHIDELFSDMCAGFFVLLRIIETEGLRMKDVRIAHEDGGRYLTIFIAGDTIRAISSGRKRSVDIFPH